MAYRTMTVAIKHKSIISSALAALLMTGAVTCANATPQHAVLGKGCHWAPQIGDNIQRCRIYSPSNHRAFTVDFRIKGKNTPVLDMYEGLINAPVNGLLLRGGGGNMADGLKNTPVTIAAPALDIDGTLQADAEGGVLNSGHPWKIRTFYLREMPHYMKKQWGISTTTRRIGAGVSMGASGLASTAFATGYYSDILLLSGVYNFTNPVLGRPPVASMAALSGAAPLYASEQSWQHNDPANPHNLQRLKNMHVTMQSATGIMNLLTGEINPLDPINTIARATTGRVLEIGSFVAARTFLATINEYVPQYGKNVTLYQKSLGVHSWNNWRSSLYDDGMLKDFLRKAGVESSHIVPISAWTGRPIASHR